MITLSLVSAAAGPAQTWPVRRQSFSLRRPVPAPVQPQHFTVQAGPQVYLRQRLPLGLDGRELVEYVSAFARTRGHDCCIEYPSGTVLYLLSDGGRFEA
jgi:hypothetical protein